ncbi:helix-turn-helix domain-containing protein [Arthrobacter alpinus]|uniref:helix-turn-helix domain-containing protein n=1 Tax=Arthrobacter alpinus TaxID=656366 RepID=UPI0009F97C8A|nr:helix-turn-helix domain-containing protein [Arthrobacter alpinus]
MDGLKAAKVRGRVGGRPTNLTPDKSARAHDMRAEGRTIKDIAKTIDVSEATVVRHLAGARKDQCPGIGAV